MNKSLFGTDGIRGHYGSEEINDRMAYRLGVAIGKHLRNHDILDGTVLLGRDPRSSGESLQKACSAGIKKEGFQPLDAGILPTPALAHGTTFIKAKIGVMVTASHNPASDNGLKLFSAKGAKLSMDEEKEVENLLLANESSVENYAEGERVEVRQNYIQNICNFFPANFLEGKHVILDTANGATCSTSPEVFTRFGAEVSCLHQGDGIINHHAGSEHPDALIGKMSESNAFLGVAHDGDGDRAVFVAPSGKLIDGDQILGLLARYAQEQNRLKANGFVSTIHSNSGLDHSLATSGIKLHRSDVGDRNVSALMEKLNCNWGGESSGHIVAHDYLPTGDGLYTALSIAHALTESKKTLTQMTEWIKLWPSKSSAFHVSQKIPLEDCPEIQLSLQQSKEDLGKNGRVLLRYSGTEPKIRLLVEAKNENLVNSIFSKIQYTIEKTL
jgi:phosphoglucosamine mutase